MKIKEFIEKLNEHDPDSEIGIITDLNIDGGNRLEAMSDLALISGVFDTSDENDDTSRMIVTINRESEVPYIHRHILLG